MRLKEKEKRYRNLTARDKERRAKVRATNFLEKREDRRLGSQRNKPIERLK